MVTLNVSMYLSDDRLPVGLLRDPFDLDEELGCIAAKVDEFVRSAKGRSRFLLHQVEDRGPKHHVQEITNIVFPLNRPRSESLFPIAKRANRWLESLNSSFEREDGGFSALE